MKILTDGIKKSQTEVECIRRKGGKIVTIGIVVACRDGIVVGADRKVVRSRGTRIKSLEDKIHKLSFKDKRGFLICSSGGADFARRAIAEINPATFREDTTCSFYRDIIEGRISRLEYELRKKGIEYDATLLFGTIDVDGKPIIGHITPSGVTEIKNKGYFTTGIAAPYAELVLRDSYTPKMTIGDAKLIVGGLIDKIGKVDNDVEGMDVFSVSTKDAQKVEGLSSAERSGIEEKPLSFNFKEELDSLKEAVREWQELFDKLEKKPTRKKKKGNKKEPEAEG